MVARVRRGARGGWPLYVHPMTGISLFRRLAAGLCAALTLVSASIAAPTAQTHDAGSLWCGLTAPSADAKAKLADLAVLLGEEMGGSGEDDEPHCPSCFLAASFSAVLPGAVGAPYRAQSGASERVFEPTSFRAQSPRGPPLGGRAPPAL